ncbi:hypothetical protein TNCV_1303291 [Trichonephila clavipes]|nr:hypothetical protein TNCV_1303291 [Trichonephila clavipes]
MEGHRSLSRSFAFSHWRGLQRHHQNLNLLSDSLAPLISTFYPRIHRLIILLIFFAPLLTLLSDTAPLICCPLPTPSVSTHLISSPMGADVWVHIVCFQSAVVIESLVNEDTLLVRLFVPRGPSSEIRSQQLGKSLEFLQRLSARVHSS